MDFYDGFIDQIGDGDYQAKQFIKKELALYRDLQKKHKEALQELEETKESLSKAKHMTVQIAKQLELLQRTLDLLIRCKQLGIDPIEKEATNG